MDIRRSNTRRVVGTEPTLGRSGTVRKPRKTYDDVQQGLKTLCPLDENITPEVDIVLVHGLGADPINCWRSSQENNTFNWTSNEDGLRRDFPRARILLYQYESAWEGSLKVKQYMPNLAKTLLSRLQTAREKHPQRPLVLM